MTSMLSRNLLSRAAHNASRVPRTLQWRGSKRFAPLFDDLPPEENTKPQRPKGPLKNENIPHRFVSFVNPETEQIEHDVPLREILRNMNRKKFEAHLVSTTPTPLVKIFSQAELDRARRAKEAAERESKRAQRMKEVQITWGVSPTDLEHKLKRVRADVLRGIRVEVVFSPKTRTRAPERAEMEKRMREVYERVVDVAVEWAPRTLDRRVGVLHLQRSPSVKGERDGEADKEAEGKVEKESGEKERVEGA